MQKHVHVGSRVQSHLGILWNYLFVGEICKKKKRDDQSVQVAFPHLNDASIKYPGCFSWPLSMPVYFWNEGCSLTLKGWEEWQWVPEALVVMRQGVKEWEEGK